MGTPVGRKNSKKHMCTAGRGTCVTGVCADCCHAVHDRGPDGHTCGREQQHSSTQPLTRGQANMCNWCVYADC
jgi:hypothetical protein